jgi:N-acetylmuramoyl-L-alanine amidase
MALVEMPSPNHDDRGGAAIDMLVLHYTGMETAQAALARLCDASAKVSAHYTVDEDGTIYCHVPEARRAWHAGVSSWRGASDINARSIGIELVNPGHEFGYRDFPDTQIEALITLCHGILLRHPIPSARVLGHSDVAPARKEDPGERFPWARLARAGVGLWPKSHGYVPSSHLQKYGYDRDAPPDKVIAAFQRHFRPSHVTGNWDDGSGAALASLLAMLTPPIV